MNKHIETIRRVVRIHNHYPSYRAKILFAKIYGKQEIKNNTVLVESYGGSNLSGNVYYILRELCQRSEYKNYKLYASVQLDKVSEVSEFLKSRGMNNVKVIAIHSNEYVRVLATTQYLINNATFPVYFIKNENQVYANTWHGTPLKTLGRSIEESPEEIGNTQRNFMMTDYMLYPNKYTADIIIRDYMLGKGYEGKHYISGYPRNSIFLNEELQKEIREENGLDGLEVIVYMPTWRGALNNRQNEEQYIKLMSYLLEIDKKLNPNQVMYVKLHTLVGENVNFKIFKNIKAFPDKYETYEFLSAADTLITDYSSVFFDFANTGRQVILFAYDKDEYLADRGLYISMEELPFPIVEDINTLCELLVSERKNIEYNEFVEEYCSVDSVDVVNQVLELILVGEASDMIRYEVKEEKKDRVLIFAGSMKMNGITTSLLGLLENIDVKKRDYTILFYSRALRGNGRILHKLPKEVDYIPIQGQRNLTYIEAVVQFFYQKIRMKNKLTDIYLEKICLRESKRLFGNKKFDYLVHFTGYENKIMDMFSLMECKKKVVYVHNDMVKERKTKSNYHVASIFSAYNSFDIVAGVRAGVKNEIGQFIKNGDVDKIRTVHNVNNIEGIKARADEPIKYDENTYSNFTVEEITEILENDNYNKFINIGRFSPEKGHLRLIEAFDKVSTSNDYLIIIGGYDLKGELAKLERLANGLEQKNIIFIKSLSNPFPILKRCDGMVMSSFYEGLPMTIMEALILDIPVVSTRIEGPAEFLEKGYGMLVDDSVDGIEKAFTLIKEGERGATKFDAEEFNNKAIREFEALFEEV